MTRTSWAILVVLAFLVGGVGGYFLGRGAERAAAHAVFEGPLTRMQQWTEIQDATLSRLERIEEQVADLRSRGEVLAARADDRSDTLEMLAGRLGAMEARLMALQPLSTTPILKCSFHESLDGWYAPHFGADELRVAGMLTLTREADEIKSGTGAARWSYEVGPQRASVVLRELGLPGPLQEVFLWLKSSEPTTLILELKEMDESRYHSVIEVAEANAWMEVRRALWAFRLADDSHDENGQLDADRIVSVAVADVSGVIGRRTGPNIVFIDEVEIR